MARGGTKSCSGILGVYLGNMENPPVRPPGKKGKRDQKPLVYMLRVATSGIVHRAFSLAKTKKPIGWWSPYSITHPFCVSDELQRVDYVELIGALKAMI